MVGVAALFCQRNPKLQKVVEFLDRKSVLMNNACFHLSWPHVDFAVFAVIDADSVHVIEEVDLGVLAVSNHELLACNARVRKGGDWDEINKLLSKDLKTFYRHLGGALHMHSPWPHLF